MMESHLWRRSYALGDWMTPSEDGMTPSEDGMTPRMTKWRLPCSDTLKLWWIWRKGHRLWWKLPIALDRDILGSVWLYDWALGHLMIVSVIAFILICLDIHGLASLVLLCIFVWYIGIHLVYWYSSGVFTLLLEGKVVYGEKAEFGHTVSAGYRRE